MTYERGEKIAEGKTKVVRSVKNRPYLVVVGNKNDITANDDPAYTRTFATKGGYATATTCRVFELLKKAGVPVAFREQLSDTEFLAEWCDMIRLEVVARRYGVGSYLKRHPELGKKKGEQPHRFHALVVEFFLKTTEGRLKIDEEIIIEGLNHTVEGVEKTLDDPLIINPGEELWKLFDPKKPSWEQNADLGKAVLMSKIITNPEMAKKIRRIAVGTFLVLEGAWQILGRRLIDFKIELGITAGGHLVVGDVIDNDSWRLRDTDWTELSKQAHRDGEPLSEVERKYGYVAALVEQFRVPRQALVLWRGSDKDALPKIPDLPKDSGINVEEVTLSGHKAPQACIDRLEYLLGKYPDGGVILPIIGRSDGLGPMLAARTFWPVIDIPVTLKDFHEDVWSSIRMPSGVPLLTAWPDENAVLAALNILAQKNPIAYAIRQQAIEELDE